MSVTTRPLVIGSHVFAPEDAPHLVGVVNASPESPNRDAVAVDPAAVVARARELGSHGVRIIDIGGQSSHFAAPLVSPEEELARLLPAIAALKDAGFLVSVDTWDGAVAREAIAAGADILNASDGLQDPAMLEAITGRDIPVIVPFINGANPRELQPFDTEHPLDLMLPWLRAAIGRAEACGVRQILVDPGTGYARSHLSTAAKEAFQRRVYPRLGDFRELGYPIFIALPRKDSRETTVELARMIIENGAEFLRVHDPTIAEDALRLIRLAR